MTVFKNVGGAISPKSVVASGRGLVSAQNMMYRHSVTTYDADGNNVATIPDDVALSDFGVAGHPGVSKGAPVEAAFSSDGSKLYVSNYSMYGAGFSKEGDDGCTPQSGYSDSFLYRIETKTNAIDGVAQVGVVPKYVATTPDDRLILVTNWCSWDLSVVDAATMREIKRVPLGAYPRGIAVSPNSATAYIAVMGARSIAKVDLATGATTWVRNVGGGPRHAVLDPAGRWLYVTLNADGNVIKLDTATDAIVGRVKTGRAPRSMTISNDGTALYVVNYDSNSVSKVRAADMTVVQEVSTGTHPIGIAYEPTRHRVWVAIYSGNILVLNDT
jgi:YVTN family beta-propeller protein